jgi:hypothetical protein
MQAFVGQRLSMRRSDLGPSGDSTQQINGCLQPRQNLIQFGDREWIRFVHLYFPRWRSSRESAIGFSGGNKLGRLPVASLGQETTLYQFIQESLTRPLWNIHPLRMESARKFSVFSQ